MTPKTLGTILGVVALAVGGVALKADEAVEVDYSAVDEATGEVTQGVAKCKAGAKEGELDCGDSVPPNAKLHTDTASAPYTTLTSGGKVAERSSPCACGPVAKGHDCEALDSRDGKWRAARAGEYLPPGSYRGSSCVPRACYELSEVIAVRGLGYSMPVACGGAAPAPKVVEEPAGVEAKP